MAQCVRVCALCWTLTVLAAPLENMNSTDGRYKHPEPPRAILQRQKRSWVWNQFFVLEEHTGTDPLYVGKLHSDVDSGDGSVRYVLTGDGASSIFTIDERTGDIHARKRLDREQQGFYRLRVRAEHRQTRILLEDESELIVKVQDINDNQPRFLEEVYSAAVQENSPPGTLVVQVSATDADDPTYGNSARIVYSITHGQPYFSVEPRTGIIRTALPNMDRELRDQYVLVIQARDMEGQMGGLSGSTSVIVTLTDVNDNPPHFTHKWYEFSVLESASVLSAVAKLKAADADIGSNAELDYSIVDGDAAGAFSISTDEETQEAVIILQQALDYETKSTFSLKIEATNRNIDPQFLTFDPFSDTVTVKIVVEDVNEPPLFSTLISHFQVSEAVKVGTVIGTVSAHDPDSSSSAIGYSIDRNTDLERFFDVDVVSGVVSTAKPLDREAESLHNITIIASENLYPSQVSWGLAVISVLDINDNAPEFAMQYEMLLCENAAPAQVIQTISAVDKDDPPGGHRFCFSLDFSAANNNNFTLRDNKDNTASVLTRRSGFRRVDQPLYLLPVLMVDSGHPALSSTHTLSVHVCECDEDGFAQVCGAAPSSNTPLHLHLCYTFILTCSLTLLAVMLWRMLNRRKAPHLEDKRSTRENTVQYDDEGGGEEDTEAFDMAALRNLTVKQDTELQEETAPVYPASFFKTLPDTVFQQCLCSRLAVVDSDPSAPPWDSLQSYMFEGCGSLAESLSSLDSTCSDSQQSSGDLQRFRTLAELYRDPEHSGRSSEL
ncbi:cadherin-7 [Danio aesculapii]|uniref:cadherin-7 n=1 Tax=Danio aesculapii TaxID=1142201 RepID=UPI0024C09409|nr:cadherin-7 [Danio aesculapii]